MRPIPVPRLADAHGLLRVAAERGRVRMDEFVTDYSVDELFPPGLENAVGRTRQFVAFARWAGLAEEERGTVGLTEAGRRYARAQDPNRPFEVVPAQAEWLRRLLRERHMSDTIYHGAAIALSLCASCPPGFEASALDFGRALSHLGRAGWDNEATLATQGERHLTFLRDLELIDGERRLTAVGQRTREELTLPVHASLRDLVAQLNPGGVATEAPPIVESASPAEPLVSLGVQGPPNSPIVESPPPAEPSPPSEPTPPSPAVFAPEAPPVPTPEAPPGALLPAALIRAAAEEDGLAFPAALYAAVAAALAGGHLVLVGPAGAGKTALALAIAKAAARAGHAAGVSPFTPEPTWNGKEPVTDAVRRGRWVILDELDAAPLDIALGGLGSFLAGVPVTLPDGELAAPADWRVVATATAPLEGKAARRFAHVHLPRPTDAELTQAIDAAASSDPVAAAAVQRLIPAREVAPLGAGVFLAAARYAAARRAEADADADVLAHEALDAYAKPALDAERRRSLDAFNP